MKRPQCELLAVLNSELQRRSHLLLNLRANFCTDRPQAAFHSQRPCATLLACCTVRLASKAGFAANTLPWHHGPLHHGPETPARLHHHRAAKALRHVAVLMRTWCGTYQSPGCNGQVGRRSTSQESFFVEQWAGCDKQRAGQAWASPAPTRRSSYPADVGAHGQRELALPSLAQSQIQSTLRSPRGAARSRHVLDPARRAGADGSRRASTHERIAGPSPMGKPRVLLAARRAISTATQGWASIRNCPTPGRVTMTLRQPYEAVAVIVRTIPLLFLHGEAGTDRIASAVVLKSSEGASDRVGEGSRYCRASFPPFSRPVRQGGPAFLLHRLVRAYCGRTQ